jgi:hypothetical protein
VLNAAYVRQRMGLCNGATGIVKRQPEGACHKGEAGGATGRISTGDGGKKHVEVSSV